MPTPMPKKESVARKWYLVDAEGRVLGRLAARVATLLMGKHKPNYAPHLDVGDHVVVINAAKVQLTGKKLTDKVYRWHTGYIGGLREVPAGTMLRENPERMVEWAVTGMLPKTKLGRAMAKKLKIYRGSEHPHVAQRPEPLDLAGTPGRASSAAKEA
ncbi:MAG: 50S ribosomal protein L13 [Candidatus Rokubacteria bacterium]|nr:50S ribosomal protein L13 [Candidatus Rokubacteria bacterium]